MSNRDINRDRAVYDPYFENDGEVKECDNCGKEFLADHDGVLWCSRDCYLSAKHDYEN
jgi:ribosomal protein S27AE